MAGDYHGYDGPCPPWNDEIVHHYVFTLYALDVERLPADGRLTLDVVKQAMQGHVLGQASITGLYALNPSVRC
jgi:Raf kinase inhibitor-like YbhB/YbcL family protein